MIADRNFIINFTNQKHIIDLFLQSILHHSKA